MISTKILLYKSKQKADGQFPIALRLIKDRKPKYIYLEYVFEKDWDIKKNKVKSSHIHSARINNLLINKLALANNLILEAESKNQILSLNQLAARIKTNRVGALSFFDMSKSYLDELEKLGKIGTKIAYQTEFNNFKGFLKSEDVYFEQITVSLLKKYQIYLRAKGDIGAKDLTLANALSFIRLIFNRAILEGEAEHKYYPFGKGKIQIVKPSTLKIGLDINEIKRLEKLKLEKGSNLWHDRNTFLFSFYLAGMRIGDTVTLNWSSIKEGRLYYTMRKNQKGDSLELPKKALTILKKYEKDQTKDGYVFSYLDKYNKQSKKEIWKGIRTANVRINNNLKVLAEKANIDKKITFHIARHSFGNIAGDKIPVQMLQKLYRHSSITTTIGYQSNFDHNKTDAALNNVLNF